MALQCWFRDDLQGAIVAGLVMAVESDGGRDVGYLRGILALARHQVLTFGLSWPTVIADCRAALGDDLSGLLGVFPPGTRLIGE